jgi:hypothetical protein
MPLLTPEQIKQYKDTFEPAVSTLTTEQIEKYKETFKPTTLKKINPKHYGAYAFVLIWFSYGLSKSGFPGHPLLSTIVSVVGSLMGILGIIYLFMWLWKKFIWIWSKFKKTKK